MVQLAVIYWSQTGNTQAMADAILEGAQQSGADAQLFAIPDIDAQAAAEYPRLALGCPAMGAEVLEEMEFEPFFCDLVPMLSGKKVALFGSYGWGDGQWMRDWQERVTDAGAQLVNDEGLILHETPDADGLSACRALGSALATL